MFLIFLCIVHNIYRYGSIKVPKNYDISNRRLLDEKIFVLGNGPSLAKDILTYQLSEKKFKCLALNKFALTDEFQLVQPEIYVLPDRRFWDKNYSEQDQRTQLHLFDAFNKVNWPIEIILPKEALQYFQKNIQNTNYVKLLPYSERALPIKSVLLSAWALRLRICTPVPINSLVIAVWFALQKRFARIVILGSDFDFFKGLQTNQVDNSVSFTVDHFYGTDSNASKTNDTKDLNKPFHVRLAQVSMAFQQLHVLAKYSRAMGIQVLNSSSYSLIDAFKRDEAK